MINAHNKTVLVTGGAGYIGSHTCMALAKSGYDLVVFDNLSAGHRDFVNWGQLIEGDLCDHAVIKQVMEEYRPAAIIHFAGLASVKESMSEPAKYYENNVVGTYNLLNAAHLADVKYVIFSSTCAVYGEPQNIPIEENHPLRPINPYGKSKLAVEMMLADFDRAYGMKHVSLRYFNAAGADPEGFIGEDHKPETHLIPLVLDVALGRSAGITIFGTDYDTPDGTCVRDYIHVADLADAHLKALDYLLAGGAGVALNLGNSRGCSVRDIIKAAKAITGRNIAVEEGSRREGDPPLLVADSKEAKRILGWEPVYSEIDIIIEHAWQWHLKRFGKSQ